MIIVHKTILAFSRTKKNNNHPPERAGFSPVIVIDLSMSKFSGAEIPLSPTCPLKRSEVDEELGILLRNRAVELQYAVPGPEPHQIAGVLSDEFGVSGRTADNATECLGKIYRNYCSACMIGKTALGVRLIARPPQK